jgi:hypothetical protein
MHILISGIVVLGITSGIFWYCLPRNGQCHRFCDTEYEPYIGVAFTSGIALGFTMVLSAAISLWGN